MIKVTNIRMPIGFTQEMLREYVFSLLKLAPGTAADIKVLNKRYVKIGSEGMCCKIVAGISLGSREEEERISFIRRKKGAEYAEDYHYEIPAYTRKKRPVVIGFGPAGMFAALVLAQAGARPIILERGKDADSRFEDISVFQQSGVLLEESNIQFGEGGAGAFSDGKLKKGLVDGRKYKILTEFVQAGADDSILYLEKAHIGSDVLRSAVKNIRQKIISLGGEVRFSSKFTGLVKSKGAVCAVNYESGGVASEIECEDVILAIGHSARDTFEKLYSDGIKMEQKPFGIGVRVEHPQSLINKLQYGDFADKYELGAADYKFVTHLKNGRSVYSFCMCPGGYVVPAASEKGGICTNGMSEFARDGENANSALLVSVTPADFPGGSPLAGIELQRKIERAAFKVGGENYFAPVQRMEDFFLSQNTSSLGCVRPTYKPGTVFAQIKDYLPMDIALSLCEGIKDFESWLNGFYFPDALLTGPETRTTSPVRILRNADMQSPDVKGLYPCGEGAGYAGGIISSAVDGMLCAERILGVNKQ